MNFVEYCLYKKYRMLFTLKRRGFGDGQAVDAFRKGCEGNGQIGKEITQKDLRDDSNDSCRAVFCAAFACVCG